MPTPDVRERQVLVDFPDDPNFEWRHRLLLVSLGDKKWIGCTPILSLQRTDLVGHRIVILPRSGPLPKDHAGNTFGFRAR